MDFYIDFRLLCRCDVKITSCLSSMDQLAMEEADSYNDCSWGAFHYVEEGSEGEGEDVDPEYQELEAEADSHRPSTQRCIMVSNLSHICSVNLFHTGFCKYVK